MKISIPVEKEVKKYIVIFYLVGTVGMILPFSFPVFRALIPWSLILSFILLVCFHAEKNSRIAWLVFAGIFAAGLMAEIIGVQTGKIFGNYRYGNSLGLKLLDTPLLIGLNWLFLVVVTGSVVAQLKLNGVLAVSLGALAMVVYDVVLEQVASPLDMWHWKDNVIPFQNYLAWFILSLLFHAIVRISGVRVSNPLALILLVCQFAFLLILSIFLS
ncbi:MAG: carotenoid biosynthesis protein [Bacteroidales bacterium]